MSHALIWSSLDTTNLTSETNGEVPFAGMGTIVVGTWNKKLYKLKWNNTSVNNIKIWLDDQYADIYTGSSFPVIKKSDKLKILDDLGFDIKITLLDTYALQQLPDAIVATSKNLTLVGTNELTAPIYIDGILLAENQNVLVKSQTTKSQNGLFYVKKKNTSSGFVLNVGQDIITASYIVGSGNTTYYAYSDYLRPLQSAAAGSTTFLWVSRANTTRLQNVVAASTTNLSATGSTLSLINNVIDSVTLPINGRVLIKDQTTASQNGIYYVSSLYDTDTNTVNIPYNSTDTFWTSAATNIANNLPVNVQVVNGSVYGGKYYRYYTSSTGSTSNLNWTDGTHFYNSATADFYYEIPSTAAIGFSFDTTTNSGTLSSTPLQIVNYSGSGITLAVANKVLVKHYNTSYSGLYSVAGVSTVSGTGNTSYWLRDTSFDTAAEIVPTIIKVTNNKNTAGGFYWFFNKNTTYQSNFTLNYDRIDISDTYVPYVYEPVTNLITSEISNFSAVSTPKFSFAGIALSQRVLVAGQATTSAQNGIYYVSAVGSTVNSFSYSSGYYINRGSIVRVGTASTYFLYASGSSSGAGSTDTKFVDITSASVVTCQAYTTKDNFNSTYKADTDFDVTVNTGDRVVINSSNYKVNGIYDATVGSSTRAKFRFDSTFANWMYNVLIDSRNNGITANFAGNIKGSLQVTSIGSSSLANIYVPEISFPPIDMSSYFTQGKSSEMLENLDIDWYEQDFQKIKVVGVYNASSTTSFPTSSGTAISRALYNGSSFSLVNENDTVLVKIGAGLSSDHSYNGIYRVKYVTSGSTGSSVYFSRHEEFSNSTVFSSLLPNVKTYASPYERPIQVINKNKNYFYAAPSSSYPYQSIYLQGYNSIRNSNLGLNAINPDDSDYNDAGSEYFTIGSNVIVTANTSDMSWLPKIAPYQHYINKTSSFTLSPTDPGNNTTDYKYPTITLNDDVLSIVFQAKLYTKITTTKYYYWEQGDRIIYEDNSLPAIYDPNYYKSNGVYQIVYIENLNGTYTYYCKRVKYIARNGHLDIAKQLVVKTGYSHTNPNFLLALPNNLTTTYFWVDDNYDKDFMDCLVIDSSGTKHIYKPNVDLSIIPSQGYIASLSTLSPGTFYAYLYPVEIKLTIKSGYTAASSKIYLTQFDNLNGQFTWNEEDYPNIKVFNKTGSNYTYYTKDIDYILSSKEGYIQPVVSFITTGTLNVYLSSVPTYDSQPKSLMNRYYTVQQVLNDRNTVKSTVTLSSSSYTVESTKLQKVNVIKSSSAKFVRLSLDRRQRYNDFSVSSSFGSTVNYVLSFGSTSDYLYKRRLSQDGINKKVDGKSEYLWNGVVNSGTGLSVGLYKGQFTIDKNTTTWVNNYSFTASDNILIKNNFTSLASDNIVLSSSQTSTFYNDNNVSLIHGQAGKIDQKIYSYVSGIDAQVSLSYNAAFTNPFSVIRAYVTNSLGSNYYCLYFDPDSTSRTTSDRYWINENGRTEFTSIVQTTTNIADLTNVSSPLNGRALLLNDLVLVKDQTNKKENGIYINNKLSQYTLSRAADLDTYDELRALGRVSYGTRTYELILPSTTPYSIGSTAGNTPIVISPIKSGNTINSTVRTSSNYTAGTLATQFPDTIDSYSLSANDKVFLYSQTSASERYVGRLSKNVNAKLSRVSTSSGGVGDTSYFNLSNCIVKDSNRNIDYELYFNPNYSSVGTTSLYWFRPDQSITYASVGFASTANINVGTAVTIAGLGKGDRVLLRQQTGSTGVGSTENLIYYLDENSTFVLARHELLNTSDEINVNKRVKVTGGTANTGTYALVYDETTTPTIDSASLYWAKTIENPYLSDCRVATTTAITISAPPTTIDGVILAKNDRILVKDQATKSENGIYIVSDVKTTTWIRTTELNSDAELVPQLSVYITEGTINGGLIYRIKLAVPRDITTTQLTNYIIGTDNIDWVSIDKNGLFNYSPETWSSIKPGYSNAIILGNAKMDINAVATSKRVAIAVKSPSASILSGNGITTNGNVRNLKLKVEYKTVED
jgi:hypothetical protein